MDKRRAIQIMTKAAQLYKEQLEDQKILFLYGIPAEINKQLSAENNQLSAMRKYEVVFHRGNFLHLTGVRLNKNEVKNTKLNVPNTLLKKDIRDITQKPMQKIYAILSKKYTEDKYTIIEKLDKQINFSTYSFSEEIEKIIGLDNK